MIKNKFKDKVDLKDLCILIGAGLLFYGLFLIYPPAAYIVAGAGFVYLGLR